MIKQCGELAKILSKHLFCAPFSTCFVEGLHDVLDVVGAFALGHFSEQHVQILHDAEADVGVVVA